MRTLITCFFLVSTLACKSSSEPVKDEEKLIEISEKILKNLNKGDFENVRADFTQRLKEGLTSTAIKEVWNGLESQIGVYQSKGEVITDTLQSYRVIYIICKFEKAPFKLKVVFDDENLVAGLFLIPVNQR